MKKIYFLAAFCSILTADIFGQKDAAQEGTTPPVQTEEEFHPSGSPEVKIFTNFNVSSSTLENVNIKDASFTTNDKKISKAFEIQRAYFGYGYKFSKQISGKVLLDVGNPKVGGLQMTAYLKNAYFQYAGDKFLVKMGMIGISQFSLQEGFWGHRYVYKSFQDANGFGPSADLGVLANYKFSKLLSADISLLNGEGYKKVQADSTIKVAIGATLTPAEGLSFRAYYDILNDTVDQQTLSFFLGYSTNGYSLGTEFNYQLNNNRMRDHNYYGFSVYALGKITKKMGGFVRYDYLTSNTLTGQNDPWNVSKDGQLFIAGVEFSPVKGIKISPNYQGWASNISGSRFTSSLYLNVEIKF